MKDQTASFEAAVQAEVAKRMADYQAQFAQIMQQTMQASLGGVDQASDALREKQKEVEKELDAAREERRKAEAEGEKMAAEYFAKSRDAVLEFTRTELLRRIARTHLDAGCEVADVARWLLVEPSFVEAIAEVRERVVWRGRTVELPHHPRLRYGASSITFESDVAKFDVWWEFSGQGALALIEVPAAGSWTSRTGLPVEDREKVVQFIAEQVVADQAGAKGFEIGESVITIF